MILLNFARSRVIKLEITHYPDAEDNASVFADDSTSGLPELSTHTPSETINTYTGTSIWKPSAWTFSEIEALVLLLTHFLEDMYATQRDQYFMQVYISNVHYFKIFIRGQNQAL